MAEFIMKDMVEKEGLSDQFYIESAGTSDEEIFYGIGNSVYLPASDELERHGISAFGKKARQISVKDYDKFDYLIGMDHRNMQNMKKVFKNDQKEKLHLLLDFTEEGGEIADPWYTGKYAETYDILKRGCTSLLEKIYH